MELFRNLEETKTAVLTAIQDGSLTYEQQTSRLAKLAENQLPYPVEDPGFFQMMEEGLLCDLDEGHAPYAPRYILPDYEKLLKEGCRFLRLEPAKSLTDALHSLLIFYRHVPSVTRYPVYIGRIDKLLNPFITDEAFAREQIRWFLIHLDRTINDSFCHANIGPEETVAGNIIVELEMELQNATPNMTLLYDPEKTSEAFAKKCIQASLVCANPAFANDPVFRRDFGGDYGIASCYNGLPLAGGAFTLSRLRLNKIAEHAVSQEDFFERALPEAANMLTNFMEKKIRFLVEETPFFATNFLVTEGFIHLDRFVGLFGVVGMHECVNHLMDLEKQPYLFGRHAQANQLGVRIMEELKKLVEGFESKYSTLWNHRFMLHAQVGAARDEGTTPGVRIQIGQETPMYEHLRQAGLFHKYFPSGIGDHFPFDSTAQQNPGAVLDIFRGGFASGMRYISCYGEDSDLIRVTGYLVKKSDVEKFAQGQQVSYDTVQYAKDPLMEYGVLQRLVRETGAKK